MVVLLMRYGANPEILDKEGISTYQCHIIFHIRTLGFNCLHIAAQFGFTSIVAYFITHPRFAIVSV